MMYLAIGLIIGVLIGHFVSKIVSRGDPIGTLMIDYSDPEDGPYMFTELKVHPDMFKSEKTVTFEVEITNFTSQK